MRVPGRQRAGARPQHGVNLPVLALFLCACLVASGCASVQDFAGIPRSGYQKDGTYVVTEEEEKLACRQIKERIDILDSRMKFLPTKAAIEEKSGPQTVGSALGRMFGGPGAGLSATTEYQRANAESEALQALLVKKQCA